MQRLTAILIFMAGAALAAGPADELQDLTRQWLAARRDLARLEADWQTEKQALTREAELLAGRRMRLEAAVNAARLEAAAANAESEDAQAAARTAQTTLAELVAPTRSLRETLAAAVERLPAGTRVDLAAQLASVPTPVDAENLGEALPALLAIALRLVELDHEVRLGRVVLDHPERGELEFQVLYLGLDQGYAVGPAAMLAAVGRPGDIDWQWNWRPDVAPAVRRAVDIYRRDREAAFVTLPAGKREAAP